MKKYVVLSLDDPYSLGRIATHCFNLWTMPMDKSFENYHGLWDGIMFAAAVYLLYRIPTEPFDGSHREFWITSKEQTVQ